jgi:hypothetical protein
MDVVIEWMLWSIGPVHSDRCNEGLTGCNDTSGHHKVGKRVIDELTRTSTLIGPRKRPMNYSWLSEVARVGPLLTVEQ